MPTVKSDVPPLDEKWASAFTESLRLLFRRASVSSSKVRASCQAVASGEGGKDLDEIDDRHTVRDRLVIVADCRVLVAV